MDFAVPANHRVPSKESEKRDKFMDFVWEMKKLFNMKTVITVVIGVLGKVTMVTGLEDLEIRERVETIQTTA